MVGNSRRSLARDPWFGTAGLLALALLALAVLGPALTPHDPHDISFAPLSPPSAEHWLGTNDGGMDLASELVHGLRHTAWFGLLGGSTALVLGVGIGLAAAWFGGAVDAFCMRLADVLLAIPTVMLLILAAVLVRPTPTLLAVLLACLIWPTTAKGIRAQALVLRNRLHVRAAQQMGASGRYVIVRHLVPELFPLYLVSFVGKTRLAVTMEATLAFLGLFDPGHLSLGLMIRTGSQFYYLAGWWHWLLPPVACLTLLLLALTCLAVSLEQAFDPRLVGGWR
ncbi:MAG: ABC transporter permease [Thermodesulfobacteriota bacterium]